MSNGPSDRYQPDEVVKKRTNWWAALKIALALVAVCAVAVWGAAGNDVDLIEGAEVDQATAEEAAVEQINEARKQQGLSPLSHDQTLSDRSRAYSAEMAAAGTVEHGSVACETSGENIAQTHWQRQIETGSGTKTYTTSEELGNGLAQQWLDSPSHRENIMSPRFSTVGVGIVEQDGEVYATQRFCG